jgi:hypothetical protein
MKILSKVARGVFFPVYWMIDVRKELIIIRELLARKSMVDLCCKDNMPVEAKQKITDMFISVANNRFS